MEFIENNWYHIYNRGNNKRPIFFEERNYFFFLEKMRKYVRPVCDIMSYCLMPNHFHFMIAADARTTKTIPKPLITSNVLSEGIRLMLSSYTKAINKQEGFTGNLFQQQTKSKCVLDFEEQKGNENYDELCLHYIHQNPQRAGLAEKMEDWKYSSFNDYAGFRNGTLCNIARGLEHFDYTKESFYKVSYEINGDKDFTPLF